MGRMIAQRRAKQQTLGERRGGGYETVGGDSYLNAELRRLKSMPLSQLRVEDLRLLVAQSRGLEDVVPIALGHVERHPLAAGHFYRGDLLKSLMQVDDAFWRSHPELRARLVVALERAMARIKKVRTVRDLESELRSGLARHRAATEPEQRGRQTTAV